MKGYLGETIFEQKETPFSGYTPSDWAMYFIERFSGIQGEHHQFWLVDQVARILKGTGVIISQASWDNGQTEWRISTNQIPSKEYDVWVTEMLGAYDKKNDEYEYSYDIGTPP